MATVADYPVKTYFLGENTNGLDTIRLRFYITMRVSVRGM